jgi:mono/diheme cytochrome c family protein
LRLAGWAITATAMIATPRVARSARAADPPRGTAQEASIAAPLTSTMTGVYSAAQATRGEETYMAICVACHPRGTYTTAAFRTAWNGRPLSDLFDLVREKMPKTDPGSLTPGEYAQAIAYLLKINDVPAGEHELPPDGEALKKIRIEWPASQ